MSKSGTDLRKLRNIVDLAKSENVKMMRVYPDGGVELEFFSPASPSVARPNSDEAQKRRESFKKKITYLSSGG